MPIVDHKSITVGHRVVAEFGNNSLNDDQIVTASSTKIAPRGFHHFETTTDSVQNPPNNGGTSVTRPAAPTLVGYTFADTIYPGYDGSMVNSELTFTVPAGTQSGDMLICVIATDDFSYTIDDAAWTFVDSLTTDELRWWWARYENLTGPITFYDHVNEFGASGTGVLFAVRGWDPSILVDYSTPFAYKAETGSLINDYAFYAPVECSYMRQGGLFLEVGMDTKPDDATGHLALLRYKNGNSPVRHLDNHRISYIPIVTDEAPDHVSIGIASARPFTMSDMIVIPNGSFFYREVDYTGYWEIDGVVGVETPTLGAGRGSVGFYIPPPAGSGINGDFLFEEYFPTGWEENWTFTETNGSDISNEPSGFDYMGRISLGASATQQGATETNVLIPSDFDMVVPWWSIDSAGGFVSSTAMTTGDQSLVISFRSTQEHSSQTLANCYAVYVNFRLKKIYIYRVNASGAHVLLGTGNASGMISSPGVWPYAVGIQANGSTIRAKVGYYTEGSAFGDAWDVQVTDSTYPGNIDGNYFKIAFMDGIPSSTGTGGGGSGGGSGGNGGGPPGGNGTANLRQMFLDRYAHPATTIAVTNDAEVASAITSLASTGGIIEMATGTYGPVSFVNVNPSQYILLMPASGATVHIDAAGQADAEGLERGILIKNSSYIGAYGLEISSVNASGHPYADCVGVANAHHIAIWNCNIHDGASGVGGVECNHYDICYNRVHHTSGWLDTFASGISLYKLVNIGGGVDADGYDNRIIGNISYNNENDPSYGGAITDGNGIIIDIANGDYATNLVGYTGRVLVMNNITINNGGRGIHSLFSRNCDIMFNTSVGNCNSTAINGQAEIDTIGSENCVVRGNISFPNAGNKWFDIYEVATTPVDNVILAEPSSYDASNNFDRSAQGSNYFGTPTIGTWTSFRPITSDEVVVDSALYSRIGGWPDALRNYRTDTTWSAGAIEVFANSSTSPDEPVAPFFYPEDYGALGNGVADDTAALQACMDAVLANGSGSMILNSSKTYCHSDVLFCDGIPMYGGGSRSGNDITGGAILWGTNDTTSNVWLRDGASAFGIIFRNDATTRGANYEHNKVTMRGNGITVKNCAVHGSYAAGFMGSAATNSTVENLIVMNTNSDSIHNTDACDNITYTDCYVENSGDDCFAIVGYGGQGPNTNITWIRPVCRGGNARGVAMVGADNCVAQDVDLQDTAYAGIYISNETISYDTEPTTNCSVTGGKVTSCANGNNGHPSILFFQDTGGTVNNCSITGVDIYNQAGDGAYFIEGRGGPTSCSATNVTVFSTPRTALTAGGITATNVVYG